MQEKREKMSFGQVLIVIVVLVVLAVSTAPLLRAQREDLGEELDRANENAAILAAVILYYGVEEEAGTDFVRYYDPEYNELIEDAPIPAYGQGTATEGRYQADNRDKFIRVEVKNGEFSLQWVKATDEQLEDWRQPRGWRE